MVHAWFSDRVRESIVLVFKDEYSSLPRQNTVTLLATNEIGIVVVAGGGVERFYPYHRILEITRTVYPKD
jgi:hypothetical protein